MKPIEGKSEARCYDDGRLQAIQNTTGWTLKQIVYFIDLQHNLGRKVIVAKPKSCNCAGFLSLFGFHRPGCEELTLDI